MMNTIIERFVSDKNIALIGVSSDKKKFGNMLLLELTKKGYTVFPVHPDLGEIEGIRCIPDVKNLPGHVTNLILVVKPEVTARIIGQLKDSPIQRVWMHKGAGAGSGSPEAIEACNGNGIEAVHGFCPMMFFAPSGFHSFHFWLRKKFGKVPEAFVK